MPPRLVTLSLQKKRNYGGVEFLELLKVNQPIDSIVAFGPQAPLQLRNKRVSFTGELVVDRIQNSYAWPDQITLNLWCKDLPTFEDRPYNDGYNRVAVPLSPKVARELARGLDRLLSGGSLP